MNKSEAGLAEKISDEQLVKKARCGDDKAMAELIARILPLVKAKAKVFSSKSVADREDLAQEGMLGFLDAVYGYKENNTALFRTYAAACVNNRMVSELRKQSRQKNIPESSILSINAGAMDIESKNTDPQDIIANEEELNRLMRILHELLSKNELEIVKLYIAGCNYEYIAECLNINIKAVDNALQRVKRKLKDYR